MQELGGGPDIEAAAGEVDRSTGEGSQLIKTVKTSGALRVEKSENNESAIVGRKETQINTTMKRDNSTESDANVSYTQIVDEIFLVVEPREIVQFKDLI